VPSIFRRRHKNGTKAIANLDYDVCKGMSLEYIAGRVVARMVSTGEFVSGEAIEWSHPVIIMEFYAD
jgi:hypothetical protein